MKLSYGLTVKNEEVEIQRLLGFLLEKKREEDEIVVLFDSKNGTSKVLDILKAYSLLDWYKWYSRDFDNHFADHKNYLNSLLLVIHPKIQVLLFDYSLNINNYK